MPKPTDGADAGPAHDGTRQTGTGNGAGRLSSLTLVPHADQKLTTKDFKSDQEVRWCPGCGDYAILAAFQSFLPELDVPRENLVIVSGIGCSSRLPYYVNSYGLHSIHGRAPAIATGLAASRQDLSVWVITGDGDALSIGGKHLTSVLRAAADHRGTAFIEIYQNCPIFNDDAFAPVTQPGTRDEHVIRLEHGQPVRFGPSREHGLRFVPLGSLEVVPAPTDGMQDGSLLVHDAHAADPSYAFALTRLDSIDFAHTPIGIFRDVQRMTYDDAMSAQIDAARERQGDGDLEALLAGSDTWRVG